MNEPTGGTSIPLRVFFTLTIAAPMRELTERFRAATGIDLDITFDPTTLLVQRIEAGDHADVVVLTKEEIDRLALNGTLVSGSTADVVRSFVGVGVKAGARKPAIETVEEFTAALRNARSIVYSQAGASGLFFADLLERLGVASEVNAKAIVIPRGFTGELAASGEAELAIQQVSELMYVPGVDVVGRLPAEIGRDAVFSAGVMASSKRQAEANALIAFLRSADAAPVMQHFGLDSL